MPRFAANLSMMFTEHDFLDRFEAAARAGFQAVEYLFPYDHSPEVIREELDRNHLVQALFNMPAGDWAAGDRGLAALPERAEEFIAIIDTAGRYAQILGCTKVHLMAGVCPDDPEHHRTYVDNVRRAADRLSPLGVTVLLEPLSPRATPGYFLGSVAQAVDLIAEIAASDEMALGVWGAARQLGLEVPRDLSIVGIDDHELVTADATLRTLLAESGATPIGYRALRDAMRAG